MKKILGLDLGTTSIGWALVNETENPQEESNIIKAGVRVNPLSSDEIQDFEKGKSITTNAARTQKRSARHNLQRYKYRRDTLIQILKEHGFITDSDILSESGNKSTFETYHLRAKAVSEEISLKDLARVLLMINKKRGYKSSRKIKKTEEDGSLIDSMDIAKKLYEDNLTPGELCLEYLRQGRKILPDFYRSDLQNELNRLWDFQKTFYPDVLTDTLKEELRGKNKTQTWTKLAENFVWQETVEVWNEEKAETQYVIKDLHLSGLKRTTKGQEQKIETYSWRVQAQREKLSPELLAIVIQEINGQISSLGGSLGAISDRSKELYFNRETVGQYLLRIIQENPNRGLRNIVFYRQDYMDEFDKIWETQAKFHGELTESLKNEIRDVVIFYQRKLKSQKGLVSVCELEREKRILPDGREKIIGAKVISRSHPLFQEFKIWQCLNDIEVFVVDKNTKRKKTKKPQTLFEDYEDALLTNGRRPLYLEEKEILAKELMIKSSLKKSDVLKLLFDESDLNLDLNFKLIEGNRTGFALFSAFSRAIETYGYEPVDFKKSSQEIMDMLFQIFTDLGWNTNLLVMDLGESNKEMECKEFFRLWHLLYSFEGDNSRTGNESLIQKLMILCGMERDYVQSIANVTFEGDYASLSAKAIRKILPHMKEGNQYSVACDYAGYRHSRSSLTKEEIANKVLKDKLQLIPKNGLRNPVVEKILNQMVNVVNQIINEYGRPDEIRIELARELKKSSKEREDLIKSIASNTKENEKIREILLKEFNLSTVSRTDIIRYKLYEELKDNNYHTLYSNKYIPRELLFSKEIDIEHIIPKARIFDDSLSNKTLEYRSVNIEKGLMTAYDFVQSKYGEEELEAYVNRCENVFRGKSTKLRKLKMSALEIPDGFVDRDLRNAQYIAKKALEMLNEICRRVIATSGSITEQLRQDWQLVDVMKELNLSKYEALGEVETYHDRDGRTVKRIVNWTKRNDHRHHAMDALTVAFTKEAYVQFFNYRNAAYDSEHKEHSNIMAIKNKYFKDGRINPPMPLNKFRAETKRLMESLLVSVKAKNKVVTNNVNRGKFKNGERSKIQLTPRGQLHLETVYGVSKRRIFSEECVNASFTQEKIMRVSNEKYRNALLKRLGEFNGNPKKAFTGSNSLEKVPLYIDERQREQVPEKVRLSDWEILYTVRKPISKDLNLEKVVDPSIRRVLEKRLAEFGGNKDKAFSNLDENPIWLNKEKGICIKCVKVEGPSTVVALHHKKDKDGQALWDENGRMIGCDFVSTGNNHHVAVYKKPKQDKNGQIKLDKEGNIEYEITERVVPFFDVIERVNQGLPVVDRNYKTDEGWQFLFTMKQNEYFVFPNAKTGFDPADIDLLNPDNYSLISPNLFRVQKISYKNYVFRHHLETTIDNSSTKMKGITWTDFRSSKGLDKIVKVRVNHIGKIVSVGEY